MQRKSWRKFDLLLVLFALALLGYGLMVIRSATLLADQPVSRQLLTQAAYAGAGIVAMALVSLMDYRLLGAIWWAIYGVLLTLLGLVLVTGKEVFGAQRWIVLGPFSFQPSEFAKIAVIICLARYLASREGQIHKPSTLLGSLVLVLTPVVLVYRQPDLGTSLVLLSIWFGMLFVAGAPLKWLGAILSVPFIAFPLIWRIMKDYMRRRLMTFLAPDRDPFGEGYNIIQARISVGSGSWWGRGLGNGTQTQLNFLKVQHTDFIFAVLGEELGFFGALVLLALFGGLFWRCLRVARTSRDAFGRYIAGGVVSMLLFQVFVNIGMNIGLAPVTGITLPFISFGGSSLISIFICLGLLQSVLIHAQARRYDTQPNVRVPSTVRIRRERFPLRWAAASLSHSLGAGRRAGHPAVHAGARR